MPTSPSFDPSKLPAAVQARYTEIGERFPSTRTLAQANRTLLALSRHAKTLSRFGFAEADGERLLQARDLLTQAGVAREQAVAGRKRTSTAFRAASQQAAAARIQARAVLRALITRAEELGLTDGRAELEATLGHTAAEPDDGEPMARQLELLQQILAKKDIAAVVKGRGGPEALEAVQAAVAALRAADQARPRTLATPSETQRLDLLDGVIVDLSRSAYQAARAAARALGQPSLEEELALTGLYGRRRRPGQPGSPDPNSGDDDRDDDGDDDGDDGPEGDKGDKGDKGGT